MNAGSRSGSASPGGRLGAGPEPSRPARAARVRAALAAGLALVMCGAGLMMAAPGGAAASPLSYHQRLHLASGDDPIDAPPIDIQTRVATGDIYHQVEVTLAHALTFTNPSPPLAPYIAPTAVNWACFAGVWVLALDRANLDPAKAITGKTFPLCSDADAGALGSYLASLATPPAPGDGSPYLVIVNSIYDLSAGSGPKTLPGLGTALAEIGADASGFGFDLNTTSYSVLGVPGTPPGTAYQAADDHSSGLAGKGQPTAASIGGTLEPDNAGNYALVLRDYVDYDIAADGTITLGGHTYPVPAPAHPGFLGGFHVLVVNRGTLAPLSDTLYETNSTDDVSALAEQLRMTLGLDTVRGTYGPGALVFVATVGQPEAAGLTAGPCTTTGMDTTCTYLPTGKEQAFTIPDRATALHVRLVGGHGGDGGTAEFGAGGSSVLVTADLPVGPHQALHQGQTLYVEVGRNGGDGDDSGNGGGGGWNGGGKGGTISDITTTAGGGGGGGGATDIRTKPLTDPATLASRLAVAAGGGGGGGGHGDTGGAGGAAGQGGRDATNGGGGGGAGTATAGGAGGHGGPGSPAGHNPGKPGLPGQLGLGGAGGQDSTNGKTNDAGTGGGGGGGVYGGGGGGKGSPGGGGGGGGGSSLVPAGGTVSSDPADQPEAVISYTRVAGPTLGQELQHFGATPTVIESLATSPRYALVGAAYADTPAEQEYYHPAPATGIDFDAPEASPLITPGATGELQGVLNRGNYQLWYGPVLDNPVVPHQNVDQEPFSGQDNLGMYDVLTSRVSDPWPVPLPAGDTNTEASYSALDYTSFELCRCTDIRTQYWNEAAIAKYQSDLNGVPYVPDLGFNPAELNAVKAQLGTELSDVATVDKLQDQMQAMLLAVGSGDSSELTTAYDAVKNSFKVSDGGAHVYSSVAVILGVIAAAAGVLPGPGTVIAGAAGIMSALMFLMAQFADATSGAPLDDLATTADNVDAQAGTAFTAMLSNLVKTFDLITSNWGKLQVVADGIQSDGSEWTIPDPGKAAQTMDDEIQLSFYRSLIPAVYVEAGNLFDGPNPANWCDYVEGSVFCPYKKYVLGTSAYTWSTNDPFGEHLWEPTHGIEVVGQQFKDDQLVQNDTAGPPFPATLMDDLTKLGLYPPYLFERWPLGRWECPNDEETSARCPEE